MSTTLAGLAMFGGALAALYRRFPRCSSRDTKEVAQEKWERQSKLIDANFRAWVGYEDDAASLGVAARDIRDEHERGRRPSHIREKPSDDSLARYRRLLKKRQVLEKKAYKLQVQHAEMLDAQDVCADIWK